MRAASSPAAKRVKAKCVAAVIAAAMNFMMNSHHPHAWTTPVDVRTAGCAMAMFRRQTAAANSTIRKGSAVGPTRWRGASMPAVGLGRVGWPPVGFGARQQARRGPQEDLYRSCAENSLEKHACSVKLHGCVLDRDVQGQIRGGSTSTYDPERKGGHFRQIWQATE